MIYLHYKDTKTFGHSFSFLLIFKTLRASYLQVGNFSFLIQHGSTFAKSEIVNLLERALLPIKNRYGENQDVIISMASVCQHKKDIRILYPYGGTDFGSFMLFVV